MKRCKNTENKSEKESQEVNEAKNANYMVRPPKQKVTLCRLNENTSKLRVI